MKREDRFPHALSSNQADMALLKIAQESLSALSQKYPVEEDKANPNVQDLQTAMTLIDEVYSRTLLLKQING